MGSLLKGLARLMDRITGRDMLKESRKKLEGSEEDAHTGKLERVKVLEKNARQSADNFRSASLYEAARVEWERAEALAASRRNLESRRDSMRTAVARRDHGMGES